MYKCQALSMNNNFEQHMSLSSQAVTDLNWVIQNISKHNGCSFGPRPHNIIIEADASLFGWGATC